MDQIGEILLQAVGILTVVGGGLWLLFKFWFERWAESKFQKQLTIAQHKHERELQLLKIEIDSRLTASLKLQEHEFETLSKAWQLLQAAYVEIASYSSPLEHWPDVDGMEEEAFEELLGHTGFSVYEKNCIRNADKKLDAYKRVCFLHGSKEVWRTYINFRDYVWQYGIFFPISIRENFRKIEEKFREAIVGKEVGRSANDWKMQGEAYIKLTKDTKQVCDRLESEINEQLRERGKLIPATKVVG